MMPGQLTQLVLLLTLTLLQADAVRASCFSGYIRCRTGSYSCVQISSVCDGYDNCGDDSDEDPGLCSFWKYRNYGSSSAVERACRYPDTTLERFCQVYTSGILLVPPPPPSSTSSNKGMTINDEITASLSAAVNSTLDKKTHDCPMLYTKIGNNCLAFFSPAKVPWAEARQFCQSIYGDLAQFSNAGIYGAVLDYMKTAGLTSSYWLGGRFDLDINAWAWVHDDSPMPLGSPFWTLTYSSSCVRRSPPHTDPFSSPPDPLPGAPCYNYKQSPSKRAQGWCSAVTYENFYYVSEEQCQETHSPLCLLTTTA